MSGSVLSVALSARHTFSKIQQARIEVVADRGVRGDAHFGVTVKHRSRVGKNAQAPNLRQVHLMPVEILEQIGAVVPLIKPGDIGENILTKGVDLLSLGWGTRLSIGRAVLEVTRLRNPCHQLDKLAPGLRRALAPKSEDGGIDRLAGVMAIVVTGGHIVPDDTIHITSPSIHTPLEVV